MAALMSHSPKGDHSSHHLYEPIEGVEKLESYRVGGYHSMTIGDHIHNRYQVVQKLGHGTYSTIWLARDQKDGKYVAIKVCTADSNPLEFSVLSELSNSQESSSTSLGKTDTIGTRQIRDSRIEWYASLLRDNPGKDESLRGKRYLI